MWRLIQVLSEFLRGPCEEWQAPLRASKMTLLKADAGVPQMMVSQFPVFSRFRGGCRLLNYRVCVVQQVY